MSIPEAIDIAAITREFQEKQLAEMPEKVRAIYKEHLVRVFKRDANFGECQSSVDMCSFDFRLWSGIKQYLKSLGYSVDTSTLNRSIIFVNWKHLV